VKSHCNSSERKLEYGRARRHRGGRKKEKLRREAVARLDEDNALESKMTQDCHLRLQSGKRLET